ncbi:hypothetical protein JKI95_10700 [Corynebacterium aquatimens]|uniref:hypothetical protein n=1 Tax=Corynebacterium TaxID=1716 RepID=UPI001F21CF20|nr:MULTISPECIES: hypothetical protein [Corynebacterium]QYH19504.1 hypothetical protein JKI95_10700 [Corynebacterium aquatimens]UIZ91556.1 hypothetical protein JZY91_07285 [Corynebacterium sp. CNCTC7651]
MNSRNAIAALTVTGLCLTGIATTNAQADTTPASPTTAAASPTTTSPAASTTTTAASGTTASGTTVTATPDPNAPVTTVVTVTAPAVTVTPTPANDASSRMMEASSLSERGLNFFATLNGIIVVLGGLIQALTVLAAVSPQFREMLAGFFV